MKIIANKNCTGKTKELIKESLETNTPILALTPLKERSLKEKSLAYFNKNVNVLNVEEAKTYSGNILIDDLDKNISDILKLLLNNNEIDVSGIVVNMWKGKEEIKLKISSFFSFFYVFMVVDEFLTVWYNVDIIKYFGGIKKLWL